jgi:PIN domain nuclease of toxin-antitoxin system
MRYLLDTHTFIWMESEPEKLSSSVSAVIRDLDNTLILSAATVWEVQIKAQIGKLKLQFPLPQIIENQLQNNQMDFLPISLPHVLELDKLPLHHRDPFDRILIAQARIENIPILSNDPIFAQYDVQVVW